LTLPQIQAISHRKLSFKSVIEHLQEVRLQVPCIGEYGAKAPSVYDLPKFGALELTVLHDRIHLLLSWL
jgi:hypothetical protein